ncbi:FUSC family protein [Nocardioides sp. DS6]|uniref:FUSC family protein n=1 Tax=Nocardioides eburneus TaxID=3231482 RepID=A0ABV3T1G5_9ACTN
MSVRVSASRASRCPPAAAWRPAAVTLGAVLLTWYAAWRLSLALGLHLDVVVLASVLALTLARMASRERARGWGLVARGVAVPVVALAASEVGRLLVTHAVVGGAVFAVVLALAVWVRRFGSMATSLGVLASLPFITLLVVPVPVGGATARTAWPAVFALLAFGVVTLVQTVAERTGFVPAAAPRTKRRENGTLPASTRMALQLLAGLAASYALGRWLFPDHWSWALLSCYVVTSGNRGRGDVFHKGVLRLVGALAGTASATLLAGALQAGDRVAVVLLFVVLGVAQWLRQASYAYWAAGATAMLALLHAFFGVGGVGQLTERLLGVTLGAVVAVVAAWFVLPVRSSAVFRRRWVDALAALSDLLSAWRERPAEAATARAAFDEALVRLEELAPAFRLHRRTLHQLLAPAGEAHPADLVALLHQVGTVLDALTPDLLAGHRDTVVAWARQVGGVRRRMRAEETEPLLVPAGDLTALVDVSAALAALDRAFTLSTWRRLGGAPPARNVTAVKTEAGVAQPSEGPRAS